jgi:hypothetical protein
MHGAHYICQIYQTQSWRRWWKIHMHALYLWQVQNKGLFMRSLCLIFLVLLNSILSVTCGIGSQFSGHLILMILILMHRDIA